LGQQHPGWQGDHNQPPGYPPSGGFPQAQPPPGQYPPPGYGQWQQPPGYPPPPRKKNIWVWLAPVLIVVVAAAVVVPILLTSNSRSNESAPAQASSAPDQQQPGSKNWTVPPGRPAYDKGLGAWEVGDTVVVAHESAVTAYNESDGKQAWQTAPPGDVGKFCGASTKVVNGQVAVAFGKELDQQKDAVCKFAALLDVKTGKVVWQQPMDVPQSVSPGNSRKGAALEIMGDVVVVGQDHGTIGLDLAAGTPRWAKPLVKPNGNDDGGTKLIGMRPGKQSVVISLSGFLSNPAITFALLDPATGALSQGVDFSSKDSANRFTTPRLVSADPPVALVSRGSGAVYIVMDDKFNKVGTVEAGAVGDPNSLQLDGLGVDGTDSRQTGARFLISDGLFVTVTTIPMNGTNKLVAYDIASGTKKWERPLPDGKAIMPLAVENGSVVTLVSPAKDKEAQRIARFSLTDGSPGPVEEYPLLSKSGNSPGTYQFQLFWHDNRLWAVRGPSNEYDLDAFSFGK